MSHVALSDPDGYRIEFESYTDVPERDAVLRARVVSIDSLIIEEIRMKSVFKSAAPYAEDAMNLPVENVEAAIPFYEKIMGFRLVTRNDSPFKSAILARDDIQIGLAENGGDPTQEGCFFEVDSAEAAFAELKSNGLTTHPSWTGRKAPEEREEAGFSIDQHGATSFKVFFVVAPDGLCYCLGERQS